MSVAGMLLIVSPGSPVVPVAHPEVVVADSKVVPGSNY